jgi:excisionase family DNA binding protein
MPRFLTLADVAEQLQINSPAAYALVRSGQLKAIQVGGRGYLAQSRGSMPFLPGNPEQGA